MSGSELYTPEQKKKIKRYYKRINIASYMQGIAIYLMYYRYLRWLAVVILKINGWYLREYCKHPIGKGEDGKYA